MIKNEKGKLVFHSVEIQTFSCHSDFYVKTILMILHTASKVKNSKLNPCISTIFKAQNFDFAEFLQFNTNDSAKIAIHDTPLISRKI